MYKEADGRVLSLILLPATETQYTYKLQKM